MADNEKASFVDSIVKDPSNPPQVKLVVGYIGKSTASDHTRIYANPELSEHIDVPQSSILHTQDVPNDHLGAKYVWISKDADITRRDSNQTEMKAKFLSGPLTARAEATAGVPMGALPQQNPSFNLICPTPSFRPESCPQPSALGDCPSIDLPCVTNSPINCPPQPSILSLCQTRIGPLCPGNSLQLCPTQPVICQQTLMWNCPIRTRLPNCPIRTLNVNECVQVTLQQCITIAQCPTGGVCPSAVDACPTRICGTIGVTFNPLM